MEDDNKSQHTILLNNLVGMEHDTDATASLLIKPLSYNPAPITGQSSEILTDTTVISPPPVTSSIVQVGPVQMKITCPHCRCRIRTDIRHRSTAMTHLACTLLCWTLCCCCLPYCMDTCRNTNHYCPMCNEFIGTYHS